MSENVSFSCNPNTKCPIKSEHFLLLSNNNRVKVKVRVIFRSGKMQQFILT